MKLLMKIIFGVTAVLATDMRYKKLTTLFVLLLIARLNGQAQNAEYALKNVIPPSATVASLGKYGEIPVSLYTGIPNISVPLYEIKDGPLSLPISLSYHAGGIRVEEIASSVGLGWSLNAGGILGRQQMGIADESGWITDAPHRIANILQSGDQYQINQMTLDIEYGFKDGEPDIYYYNFNGQSGKFFFGQDGTLHNYPIKNISVTPTSGGWKIITEDGTAYDFDKSETVTTGACSGYSYATTAWYLTKITSNDGKRQISFTYEIISYSASTFLGQTRYFYLGGGGGSCYIPDNSQCDGVNLFNTQQLKRIDFSGGYVKFNYNNARQDILADKSLDQIEIYSPNNTLIKKYDFAYSYFNPGSSNPDDTRLKLTSITEKSATGQKPPYTFTYEESVQLPNRQSAATDHWGYYNGKNNTSHIASFKYSYLPGGGATGFDGADKNANPATMQAGILKKIQYPTGGETGFTYETNATADERIPATTYTQNYFYGLNQPYASLTSPYETGSFTIPSQGAEIHFAVSGLAASASACGYEVNLHCYLIKDNDINNPVTYITDATNTQYFQLPGGSYKFRFTFDGNCTEGNLNYSISLEAKIPVLSEMGKRPVGGLRIKQIEDKPGNGGQSVVKKYRYETEADPNISSGVLVNFPEYGYELTAISYGSWPQCIPQEYCAYLAKTSKTNYPLATSQGSYVGYSHVIEDLEQNGEIHHSYNISSFQSSTFPFPPVEANEWEQGAETATKYYAKKNGQFILSKQISYGYYFSNPDFVNGYIAARPEIDLGGACHNFLNAPLTTYTRFPRFFAVNHINERQYDQNDPTKYIETVTDYTYNTTHYQLAQVSKQTSSSDAIVKDEVVVNKKYPQDYVFNGTPSGTEAQGIKKLQDLHIVNFPIEEYNYRQKRNISTNAISDQKVINGMITTFKFDNPYPDQVYRLETNTSIPLSTYGQGSFISNNMFIKNANSSIDNQYKPAIIFNSYDNYGNLTQQQKANDVSKAYVWGYNKTYPVAEIVDADFATAQSYVTQSVLDAATGNGDDAAIRSHLNNLRNIPNALVTTYTYKPLVGMTSQTDANGRTTYYEYDVFNRLILIRDKDNNIVKKICYNYAGQPEDCTVPCTNFTANWQNTNTALRCQQGSCGNTGYQEQEQKDINPCSSTYNTTQWVVAGYNPTACPSQTCVSITSTNSTNQSGYIASYYNTSTGVTYNFTIPVASGLQTLGNIPVGTYNLTISKPGGAFSLIFKPGCKFQSITGTSAVFNNISVSSLSCNSISIAYDLQN
jgi:YD repeat-containing protein